MKRATLIILVSVLLCVSLTACGGKNIRIAEAYNGQTLSLKQGDTLTLSLAGNPTTGYNWELNELDQSILEQQGETEYKAGSTLLGAGGVYTFTFKAVAPGSTTLMVIYYRSFEKDVPPIDTFEMTITVE